ncbi:MAG: hypothetical protein NTZ35_09715 [Ignavibacteriales bacterium]|nr:hypothetical protein [Ignavibacteriales bacterium]
MNLTKLEPNRIIDDLYGNTVLDFWSWAFSDLISGSNRGIFAEFLIGAVLGTTENARIEWDVADHIYRGRKIKVKSAAYIEHWLQSKPSRISFPVNHIQRKEIKTSIPGLTLYPRPEVYVFCVFDVRERNEADMLDMGKWLFYPVAAHVIESKYRRKKSITLKEVQRVAPSVRILQLRRAIDGVIEELNSREPHKS